MSTGVNHINPGAIGVEDFIPEEWSDNIVALYDAKTAMKGLVNIVPHSAGAGDIVNIPVEGPGTSPSRKAFQSQVTLQNHNSSSIRLTVDEHWEYSYLLEDKENSQSMASLKPMLAKAAGRNMARILDASLMAKATSGFQNSLTPFTGDVDPYAADWGAPFKTSIVNQTAVIGSDANTIYNGTNSANLTDAAVLAAILRMENSNIDTDDLVWVLPPSAKRDILSIDKHVLVDNTGSDQNYRGQFGELYGIPVVLTNACPIIDDGAAGLDRIGMLMSREAMYLAYQWEVRSQMDYEQSWLGHLFTFDNLFGATLARPDAGISIVIPNA